MMLKSEIPAVEIQISGRSGYVPSMLECKDRLVITDHSIEYECTPREPWTMNPNQKWSFTTNSIAFRALFALVADAVHEVFRRDPQCSGTDMPETVFTVTYRNGKTLDKTYFVERDEFAECFGMIKKMVPGCELMPVVLEIPGDYEERRLWHEIVDRYCQDEVTESEAAALYDAMWDLKHTGKTKIRCPRCGSELRISVDGNSAVVFCTKEGCISAVRRGL